MISVSSVINIPKPAAPQLTKRELEVLELLTEGLSNKLIAARLDISDSTAKYHINNICQKLGKGNRVLAAVTGLHLGLVS